MEAAAAWAAALAEEARAAAVDRAWAAVVKKGVERVSMGAERAEGSVAKVGQAVVATAPAGMAAEEEAPEADIRGVGEGTAREPLVQAAAEA